jgi:hypothetical protein
MPPITPPETVPEPQLPPPVAEVPVEPKPVEPTVPQLPERELQWGRFRALAGAPASITLDRPAGSDQIIGGAYVIYRTAGRDYVAPERGSVSFKLQGGEAMISYADLSKPETKALLQNGLLDVDFGKQRFTTSFDLVDGTDTLHMLADGDVASSGRFGNSTYDRAVRPQQNNMDVDGVLSNANGGSAAYVFKRILDDRTATGVTLWGKAN